MLDTRFFYTDMLFKIDSMGITQLWQKPSLINGNEGETERKTSWLELFYDLVFVAAISQLAHRLYGVHPENHIGEFILLFIPVWMVWMGSSYYNDLWETDGVENRLMFLTKTLAVAGLGIFAHGVLEDTFVPFILSYILGRAVIVAAWIRVTVNVPEFRSRGLVLSAGFGLSLIIALAAVFLPPPLRYIVWGISLVIDLLTPLTRVFIKTAPIRRRPSKLPERLGLMFIIVLGESIVGVVAGMSREHSVILGELTTAILGIILSFSLWWIYFDFVGRRSPRSSIGWVLAWAYLHLLLVMAVTAGGVGISNIISNGNELTASLQRFLGGAVGLSVLLIGFIEAILHRGPTEKAHPTISPALKIISGVTIIALGFAPVFQAPWQLLGAFILVNISSVVYSIYIWTFR
jgi:low temperature requirement protein LtrA